MTPVPAVVRSGVHGRTALWLALVLAALALAGCRGEQDPRAELRAAAEATADESFTFALSARADRAALDQLGGDAVAAASFLEGAGLWGARDPDGRFQVAVTLGGDAPLLEVISEEGTGLLLRTGLGDLLGLEGRDPEEALAPALDRLGVDPAGRDALAASFEGRWVALTDVDDLGELLDTAADDAGATAGADPADGAGATTGDPFDLDALLERVTVTDARDAGDVRRLDVLVSLDALVGTTEPEGAEQRRRP